ncbi:Spock1 [Columba guinea]|nr:Spock1 [Columba guinea]
MQQIHYSLLANYLIVSPSIQQFKQIIDVNCSSRENCCNENVVANEAETLDHLMTSSLVLCQSGGDFRAQALDPSKDPCLKVKCSPHKVCVTHDYETAICVSRKQLVHSLRQKKGALAQKHWAGPANIVKCKPCPMAHGSAVCGSDGHTYTSKILKLFWEYFAVHRNESYLLEIPILKFLCLTFSREKVEQNNLLDVETFSSLALSDVALEACTDKELRNLASRLKDWFGALHEDANRVIKPTSSETAQGRFDTSILPICKDSLGWMFNKLDMNYDLLLDPSEISAIYLDKYEPCVKPLFNSCDSFKDGKLSNNEWCYCFQKPGGAFIPRCNEEGYYKATQCHGSTGQCWCVDKYGNEIAGSRKQGTVTCGIQGNSMNTATFYSGHYLQYK